MRRLLSLTLPRTLLLGLAAATVAPSFAQACRAESGARVPLVVELYTSEGCNACPPADRWLSTLRERPDVLAAAFHVDYWDRLGWVDRFASAHYSQRQARLQAGAGSHFSYTPQVLVNGRDWRRWPQLPAAGAPPDRGAPRLSLQRTGDVVDLRVQPNDDRPGASRAEPRWSLWWAALEDGHVSVVSAGENGGTTLHHDAVVRAYGSVGPWRGPLAQRLQIAARGDDGRPRRVIAVLTDAASGATVQALQLRCAQ